jgi:hypothetical protein
MINPKEKAGLLRKVKGQREISTLHIFHREVVGTNKKQNLLELCYGNIYAAFSQFLLTILFSSSCCSNYDKVNFVCEGKVVPVLN